MTPFSEHLYRALIDHSVHGVAVVDAAGSIVYGNPAISRILGYTHGLLIGAPAEAIFKLIHPDDVDDVRYQFNRVFKDPTLIVEKQFRLKHFQGRWVHLHTTAKNCLDIPEIQGVVIFYRDITAQIRSEEALKKRILSLTSPKGSGEPLHLLDLFTREELQLLQDRFANATGVASLITEPDGTPITEPSNFCALCDLIRSTEPGLRNCRVSDAEIGRLNTKSVRVQPCLSGGLWDAGTGIEVAGQHIGNWLVGQVRDESQSEEKIRSYAREIGVDEDAAAEAFSHVKPMSNEQFQKVAEAVFILAKQLSNMAYQNVLQARVIANWEGAEQERAKIEEQFVQAQKMESIGRLTSGIAHDFNNLLTGITGAVQLAQMKVEKKDPLYETLGEINIAAMRAADLTQQLLSFSRKRVSEQQVFNLNELIHDMSRLLMRIIGENITLNIPQTGDVEYSILGYPGQVEQILVNMVVNARDAMSGGGSLTLDTVLLSSEEARALFAEELPPGETWVTLIVSDSGKGIEDAVLPFIFTPFFTTKSEGKGTGLGLSTVKTIMERHGGTITVRTTVGSGTRFILFFQKADTEVAPAASAEQLHLDLKSGNETILVVEDEDMVRKVIIKILKVHGYNVLAAASGRAALNIAREYERPIHLLLTDVVMPGMNGHDLAQRLVARYSDLKVIYSSGYVDNILDLDKETNAGLHFLRKPYTPRHLTEIVRKVLDDR